MDTALEAWETYKADLGSPDPLQQIVGTLAGFPAALQEQEGFTLLSCYFLERQGWPVGPNAPACGRPRLLPVPPDVRIDYLADGRPRITWRPPPAHPDDTGPVTGYTILLNGGDFSDARFDLPANPRSFVLPPSPIGEYQLGEVFEFTIIPRSANRLGYPERVRAAVGFRQTEIRIREINPEFNAACIENCPPRSFELSWPSNDLVEDWTVLGMEGSYWNRSTGASQTTGVFRNSTTVTEGFGVIRGKTYDFTVFGCLKDPPPGGSRGTISPGCFPYATATFTPEAPETRVTSGAVTWIYTGTAERHRVYSAEWTHIPGITVYFIFVKGCTDTLRPCHFEDAWGASVEPDSSGTVTTHGVFLLYGTRYEVDIHACGPEDDSNQPMSCPILLRSEVTVPPSDS